jgi:ABC-type multidrug transport system fused ATPase/permease subunit
MASQPTAATAATPAITAAQPASKPKKSAAETWKALPEILALLRPRKGLLALGFLLMTVNRLCGLILPASTKYLVDNVFTAHQMRLLLPIVLSVIAATLLQGLSSFTLTQLLSKSAQRMISDMRQRVQAHIGKLSVSYYDSHKTGELVSRIMSDVEGIRNLIGTGLVEFLGGLMTAVFALVILLKISTLMTLVAFAILIVFGFGISKAFATIRPIFRARPKINAEVTGRLTESLGGVRVVKGYHAEEREEKVFGAGVHRLLDNVLKTLTATSLMSLSGTTLIGLVSAIVMYISAHRIVAGTMTAGMFFMYSAFLAMLVAPVFQIVAIGTQLTEAITGLERTREILKLRIEDEDDGRSETIGRLTGEVIFENVDFSYEPGKQILFDINFVSLPGTVTALVGPSGAGKSTIIGLIAAFYKPERGRVLADGIDLASVKLSSYRTQLGVVLQDTFLFDGSIRENVAFARPEASGEEIMEACRIARVDEFAESFEKKYDTVVGERGVRLSGGQKQRVSIARAILADPRILILDEATSSLDSESEALIQEGLRYLMRGRTTFVIAHRLSTIRRAEQILVVEGGRIIERGTHQSLYALGGRYYDLYTRQHGLESNLFLAPGEGDGSRIEEPASSENNGRSREAADPLNLLRGAT